MNIHQVKIVDLEDISSEEFVPYGKIWGREEGEPLEVLENLKFYAYNTEIAPVMEMVETGLLVCNDRGRDIRYLERHPETAEIFIPIQGECLFVMAPGNSPAKKPDIDGIRAFYLNGTLGVALPPGNWHWPPIPIGDQVKLLLIRRGSNADPCDTVELKDLGLDRIQVTL